MTFDCIINHWIIDASSSSLIHQQSGEQRRLGEYQFRLLQVLVQHAGQILSREALNRQVWQRRVIGNNSLPNAIHALRIALDDNGTQQQIIRTIPRKGYILEASFCQFRQPPAAPPHAPECAENPVAASPPLPRSAAQDSAARSRWPLICLLQLLVTTALLVALAVTLNHWRLDSQRLNHLLSQQAARSLAEIAGCHAQSQEAQRQSVAAWAEVFYHPLPPRPLLTNGQPQRVTPEAQPQGQTPASDGLARRG